MREPHVIRPTAVYDLDAARRALSLSATCLNREIRLGRLRVAHRGKRYWILGEWLLEWLRSGELKRRRELAAVRQGSRPGDGEP